MICTLIDNTSITDEVFRLDFKWPGTAQTKFVAPKAGQFFMIKPKRSSIFLARPIGVAAWKNKTVTFLITRHGKGTQELGDMRSGEKAELIGPLGNAWTDFLPPCVPSAKKSGKKPIALVSGGIGLAPLNALLGEKLEYHFHLYAGFKTGFKNKKEKNKLLKKAYSQADSVTIATEDGTEGLKGRIPDFLEPAQYAAVCACGPELMMRAVAEKCKLAGVPCFISMEKRMACGAGACLGCTIRTVNGNRRCCADGPIFKADEVIFDE